MNAKELFLLRREFIQVVAMMQPELSAEIAKMDDLYDKTAAAAAIIGTAAEADKLKLDAEEYLKKQKAAADEILVQAQSAREVLEEEISKLEQSEALLKARNEELTKAKHDHEQSVAAHKAQVAITTSSQSATQAELNKRSQALDALESALTVKEQTLQAKLKKMSELAA